MLIKDSVFFTPTRKTRNLHIYLPPDYQTSRRSYPVMYFFDGHNLFEDRSATYGKCWGLEDFLDKWGRSMIIVGLECGHEGRERLKEYCPYHFNDAFFGNLHGLGDETLRWMVTELKPMIDKKFRTLPQREYTGIGGSSMGGLMSLYGIIRFNRWFSRGACLSSTITPCPDDLVRDIHCSYLQPGTRVWLSWGTREGEGCDEKLRDDFDSYTARCNRLVAAHLRKRGAEVQLYCQPDGRHCEADWEKQNGMYMNYLWA